jgi:hypothetical protein
VIDVECVAIEDEGGNGIDSGAFGDTFGHRIKLVRLTLEPKPITVGIAARKGRLSTAAEKFWQCAKKAVAANLVETWNGRRSAVQC